MKTRLLWRICEAQNEDRIIMKNLWGTKWRQDYHEESVRHKMKTGLSWRICEAQNEDRIIMMNLWGTKWRPNYHEIDKQMRQE